MYLQSQRNYTHQLTGEKFNMNYDSDKALPNILVNDKGETIKAFLVAAFDKTEFKLKDKTIVVLNVGEFLPIDKNNPPTHKRFSVFSHKPFCKY